MTFADISRIIQEGESSLVEFKNENFHPDSLAKEIVAFSNFHGGCIYIGIDDDQTISGVTNYSRLEEKVVNICRNNIQPSIIPQIKKINLENKLIIELFIEKGKFKPYKVKSSNKFYIRVGSISIEPTNEELIRLFQESQQLHFEVSPVIGSSINDVETSLFREYCSTYRDIVDIDLPKAMYNWQLMNEENVLTVAGTMLFAKNPSRYLPQSGIELFLFHGNNKAAEILEMKTIEGNIPYLIESTIKFVNSNSKIYSNFTNDVIREDSREYPQFVIRELVTNAFLHRDWSIFGQKIKVSMFSDKIEIFFPGKLPNTLTLLRAVNGISYYRNPIITQIIKDYGFAEKAGRGLFKIVNYYTENNYKLPEFEDDNHFFKVTLFKIISRRD